MERGFTSYLPLQLRQLGLIHGDIRVSPAGPQSAFSLQPANVIIIFLQLVSDSLAEKDAVERDYLALVAGDRRGRRFHLVCRHANSRLSSASPVAGRRFGRVCIFTGARCQLACQKKGASTPGCHYRVWSVCPGCSAFGRWSRSLALHRKREIFFCASRIFRSLSQFAMLRLAYARAKSRRSDS